MPVSRKVLIRVVGAPLLLAALGLLLWSDYRSGERRGVSWLIVGVIALSMWEFCGLCRKKGVPTGVPMRYAVLVTATLGPIVVLFGVHDEPADLAQTWSLGLLAILLCVLLALVFRHGAFTVESAALLVLGYGYVSLLGFLLVQPVSKELGILYLLFVLAANKGSDMAAYVVGKSIGKHKMAPVLSPNKTWEGCVGGAVGGTGAAMAVLLATPLHEAYKTVPVPALLFLAFLVTMSSQVGDLVESAFKRWAGVKDSGRLLPEFGGILDMVDSFIISAPVAYLGSMYLMFKYKGG